MTKEQIRINRLIISEDDLLQALEFVRYILDKRLHDQREKEAKLIHLAFNMSLIISYARPFRKNKEGKGKPKSSIPSGILGALNRDEEALHKRIIASRDTEYAHSDADSYSMKVSSYQGILSSVSRNPFITLTKAETKRLASMIEKIIGKIVEEREKLK